MNMGICCNPSPEPLEIRAIRERVQLLLELSRFQQALAEVLRFPDWKTDPAALQLLGLIMHRCAPHSSHRRSMYSSARATYRTAAASTRDASLHAELLTGVGACYFEEGRLRDAVNAFEMSRAIAPGTHRAHLGLIALACATRDLAAIRRRCRDLVQEIPDWHVNREAVALLAVDPDFAFLRASPELFRECLGGYPDHLRALHDRYCMEALERGLTRTADPPAATLTKAQRTVPEEAGRRRPRLEAPGGTQRRIDLIEERARRLVRSFARRPRSQRPTAA